MSFHEVQFPTAINYGSSGGPGMDTSIVTTDSGIEQRVARLSQARHRYNVAYAIKTWEDLYTLREFYAARLGPAIGFRFKDWMDYATTVDGITHSTDTVAAKPVTNVDTFIALGDGTTKIFQLQKSYTSFVTRYRTITKPVDGTVLIALDTVNQASGWAVDPTTGILTFTVAPGDGVEITAGFEFDVPTRFGEELDVLLSVSIDSFSSGSSTEIPIVEIVSPEPNHGEFHFGGSAEIALAADTSVSLLTGRVLKVTPSAASLSIILPTIYPTLGGVPMGGPAFYIQNMSDTYDVTLTDYCGVTVATLEKSTGMAVLLVGASASASGASWIVSQ